MIQAILFLVVGLRFSFFIGTLKDDNLFLFLVSVGITIFIIYPFGEYVASRLSILKSPKMKWKTIKDIYRVNPERWFFNGDFVPALNYNSDNGIIYIATSFLTYQRLKHYIYKKNKQKAKKKSKEELISVLETAQRDIDKKKEEVKKQFDEARVITIQIANNLSSYPNIAEADKAIRLYLNMYNSNTIPLTVLMQFKSQYNINEQQAVEIVHKHGGLVDYGH